MSKAIDEEKEYVESHKDIIKKHESEKKEYTEKLNFLICLLIAVFISYVLSKIFLVFDI